ncbi:MAG: nitroreductase family protein [Candidatus Kapaibacterium sp.]
MIIKRANTKHPIALDLSLRWSPRAFNPDKNITREQIIQLCEAARWAPSCNGEEPWRYLVFDRQTNPDAWQKAFECLTDRNQRWVKNVPLLFAAIADTIFLKGKDNPWGKYDTGAASENLCLQAVSLGMAAHQMAGFDPAKLAEMFSIPERYEPVAMIAVGFQAAEDTLEEDLREREKAERFRRPLEDTFFDGEWGNSISE